METAPLSMTTFSSLVIPERRGTGSLADNPLINRELSWIEFNSRVLDEALDPSQPLLERLKFLSIFSTNLDEFFMVRVSGLQEQLEANPMLLSPDGLTPATQLRLIAERLHQLLKVQMRCLRKQILPGLENHGVRIVSYEELNDEQRKEMREFFYERIFPILTPLSVDPSHPFPYISNISLNLGILVVPENPEENEKDRRFARVKLPPNVPRLIPVRSDGYCFVMLEEVMAAHIDSLFPGMRILECQPFRITRDADIEIEEDEAGDLLKTVEQQLRRRRFGFGVRLEIAAEMSKRMIKVLRHSLELEEQDIYTVDGPLNIPDLMTLYKLDLPQLKDVPFTATTPASLPGGHSIFDAIRTQDILLHHPYESFAPVVELLRQAARDPNVVAVKQTLYRVGKDSPIVEALIEAAENGKQVAVLVELKARFDEENNIQWARRLEQAGAHVVYGLIGLKTHAKLTLVVRQEKNKLRRYVHLGTGNYNPATARLYTDLGLLTCDDNFGKDVSELFNYLTGYSRQERYRRLLVAPVNLRQSFTEMIRREIGHHQAGRPAGIIAKFNSFTDAGMIEEMYAASREGVPIDLIVRGICCLRPGWPGKSATIRVGSIVGRFLEHSRIYRFLNGGDEEIYLGSADLMNRNLDRRVEVLFPIEDPRLRERIVNEILEPALEDNVKMRWLQMDGSYSRPRNPDAKPFNLQEYLLEPALIG
ncbi:MAG TPA: polyphosphate kinase 1 [Blastocatellia bacterium]|nr:polyphosphate kinase 1 [Blastocatellia bacterium]HMV85663.1 polyphosphate kinase 1 [Blastocatellia bacterium]HMX26422.1 polyphosphate kinase 1 [Blastocatellia bacterium]HMZ17837.1 polyphosphate kinase 1 [Blastocatellia bacterium]HNG29697.1 polyphosphate kinase 1 [Blastocatellia bacterium]